MDTSTFPSVYQPVAHNYIKELFGAENVFRAGTIGTIARKERPPRLLRKYMEGAICTFQRTSMAHVTCAPSSIRRTTLTSKPSPLRLWLHARRVLVEA